jgi:tRNA(Ile)-lysidine synthase
MQSRPRAQRFLDELLRRCTFPTATASVDAAFSGGPDSTALVALARRAGLDVVAHHVDHRIRPESTDEATRAATIAAQLGARLVLHRVTVEPGPNLEARARAARRGVLPTAAMTGHTLDDQAETVLLRLLRGSGSDGLSAIEPGPNHPILALRRSETEAVCELLEIEPVRDRSNASAEFWRNRVRHELIPLASAITRRDPVPILARTADLLRDEHRLLDRMAGELDPTDAKALAVADPALARRALRRWLTVDGYPPDAACVERAMAVARGEVVACELPGGRRVERSGQRLRVSVARESPRCTAP